MYIRLWQSWKRKTRQQSRLLNKIIGKKLYNVQDITCEWVVIIYYLYPAVFWWSWHPDSGILFVALYFWWSLYTILHMIIIIILLLSCQNGVETDNKVHSLTYQCPYNAKSEIGINSSRKVKLHKFSFQRF